MERLEGKRFGKLVVTHHVGFTKHRNAIWHVQCDCGNEKDIPASNLKSRTTRSCGCLFREVAGNYHKLPDGEAAFNDLYARYKRKAEIRHYIFDLSKEDFRRITTQNCYYCGLEPKRPHKVNKRVGVYYCNGVDRKNNTIGYIKDNVVSCCYLCNKMKSTMSELDFLTQIERIYRHASKI